MSKEKTTARIEQPLCFRLSVSVLGVNVYIAYSGAEDSDFVAFVACFDGNGFVLDGNYLADNAADGCNPRLRL